MSTGNTVSEVLLLKYILNYVSKKTEKTFLY